MKADPRHPKLAGLDEAIGECRASGGALSLVHLDIDGFRRQLVIHGHLAACSKLRSLQRVIAASAILCGRMEARVSDFWVLKHIWDTEEQQEPLRGIVQAFITAAPATA